MRRGARSTSGRVVAAIVWLLGAASLTSVQGGRAAACGGPWVRGGVALGGVPSGGPGGAVFFGLGTLPGGTSSRANAVTSDGTVVVGSASSPSGTQAFRWTESGGMVALGDLPGGAFTSVATSVSTTGNVVVGWSASANGPEEAFRWTSSGMVGLGDLPGGPFASRATDVSSNGNVVVGYGRPSDVAIEAFRWTLGGSMSGLGDLPGGLFASRAMSVSGDGQSVTGWGNSGSIGVNEAFLWSPQHGMQGLGFIPGSLNQGTQGIGISFDGSVVVGSGWAGIGVEAFRWRSDTGYLPLGDLPGGTRQPYSTAFAVSADGTTIVGAGSTELPISEAIIWTETDGLRHLGQLLESLGVDLSGWVLKEARGVSVDGQIVVGVGAHNGVDEAWLASLAVPCPADLNGDGVVNVQDTLILLASPWGPCDSCGNCPGDINGDCAVGMADLLALLSGYGACR